SFVRVTRDKESRWIQGLLRSGLSKQEGRDQGTGVRFPASAARRIETPALRAVAAAVRRRLETLRRFAATSPDQLRRGRPDRLDRSLLGSLCQSRLGLGVLAV